MKIIAILFGKVLEYFLKQYHLKRTLPIEDISVNLQPYYKTLYARLIHILRGELKDFIAEALITKDTLLKRVISTATESLVNDLQDMGIAIDETYRHTLDNSAVRHAIKSHGSPKEVLRGQIPITDDDLMSGFQKLLPLMKH